MEINAPFYVMNEKDELVPAKFLVGPDGQYITNPNSSLNTINWRATRYFNADGSEIRNANPANYLVVPYNYTLGHAIQFSNDINNAASQDISPNMMMAWAFTGGGSQNLQRTYQNADGNITYGGNRFLCSKMQHLSILGSSLIVPDTGPPWRKSAAVCMTFLLKVLIGRSAKSRFGKPGITTSVI